MSGVNYEHIIYLKPNLEWGNYPSRPSHPQKKYYLKPNLPDGNQHLLTAKKYMYTLQGYSQKDETSNF